MISLDPRMLARFDRFLDALVAGRAADAAGLPPQLSASARRLHALIGSPPAADTLAVTRPNLELGPAPDWRSAPRQRRGHVQLVLASRPVTALATVVLFLALVVSGSFALLVQSERNVFGPATDVRLFVAVDGGNRLVPLDPETLADRPAATPFPAATPTWTGTGTVPDSTAWIASADGSTLVRLDVDFRTSAEVGSAHVTIYDGTSGRVRSTFVAPAWQGLQPLLTPDGRLIVFEAGGELCHEEDGTLTLVSPPTWYVVETASGRTLTTITADAPALPSHLRIGTIDPAGERLFYLVSVGRQGDRGPWPSRLVVHDLITGRELARLDLPEVRSGYWWTGKRHEAHSAALGGWLDDFLAPWTTFTPDGTTLLLLDGDASAVTLIDAERLTIQRRLELSLLPGLAFDVPDAAVNDDDVVYATNVAVGPNVQVIAAPEGDRLILSGIRRARIGPEGEGVHVEDLGIQVIDLTTGRATARAAVTNWRSWTIPVGWLARGGSLYVVGPSSDELQAHRLGASWQLWRLDPVTLTVLAQRELTGPVVVMPTVPA